MALSELTKAYIYLLFASSDLWVAANVPNAQDSGKSASLSYAIGSASGMFIVK